MRSLRYLNGGTLFPFPAEAGQNDTQAAFRRDFAKGTAIPSIPRLHFAEVGADARQNISGVPVTNSLRTIIDIWREGTLPKPILRWAFTGALRQGKLTSGKSRRQRGTPLWRRFWSDFRRNRNHCGANLLRTDQTIRDVNICL